MSFWDDLQDSLGSIGDLTSTLFNPIGSVANVWATVEGVKQNKKVNDLNYRSGICRTSVFDCIMCFVSTGFGCCDSVYQYKTDAKCCRRQ